MKDIQKQQVNDLLMSFETKDLLALEVIHPSRFIQHNHEKRNNQEKL